MRPIVPSDLDHCTRALLGLSEAARARAMATILHRADTADRYRKRTGRLRAGLGDGSLMTAAWTMARTPPPPRCDADYCHCLAMVIAAIADWRQRPIAARDAAHHSLNLSGPA